MYFSEYYKQPKYVFNGSINTGSTLLLNLIHGYLLPECEIVWGCDNVKQEKVFTGG